MLILIFWHTVDTFLSSTYAREFWSSPSVSLAGLALASVSRALLINLPIDRWQEAIRLWCNDVRQSSMHATQFKSSHVGSTHFWCWQRRPTHTTLMIPSRKKDRLWNSRCEIRKKARELNFSCCQNAAREKEREMKYMSPWILADIYGQHE
jgi:hypothetical protein